jgi:hypothetical protein
MEHMFSVCVACYAVLFRLEHVGLGLMQTYVANERELKPKSGLARSGVAHAAKSGRHSDVHFVLKTKMEMPAHFFPRAVLQYTFVW